MVLNFDLLGLSFLTSSLLLKTLKKVVCTEGQQQKYFDKLNGN